ncbi:dTDP-glucose 4,6-dehydratase [Paenibacillus sp. DMB20]|uniref:dTDP-glucose 4,6-dehydratase n=1 Tax=Paenibacillus sp. DMB20 TaxID=1642570 RepID=UPI000627E12A|nr:dTDP-glucose 4,6-dehydratase [Paenibacillus sp. DMB20]KKO55032.1 spore coat protein [Paenibacillus sp. DMB20]
MKLLVTGGAGFIGSNFIRYMSMAYPEYTILNVDSLTYAGNLNNLNIVENSQNYHFYKLSITQKDELETLFQQGVDIVVNFAAESHVDRSIMDPNIFVMTNIVGTQTLLELSKTYNVQKYVQISTDEVYGSLGKTGLFSESTPLAPNSPYSASKAGADLLVRAYHETYGLPVNITRCSNNYGPYQFPEKLIPLMIINALNDTKLPVYGDGLNVRDWLHVKDHCRAIDLVIHNGVSGEVYNIGGNNEYTNINIVKLILELLDKPDSLIEYVEDRLGHDKRYAIDATKIKSELNWQPLYNFETGIRESVQWYLENEQWWTEILNGSYQNKN